MRHLVLAFCAAALAGSAFAQAPQVSIEDDVAPANALKCAALRMAQVGEAQRAGLQPEPLIKAALDAWVAYPGVDAVRAKNEAVRIAAAGVTLQKMAADACATFEIRSLARPVG